MGSQPSNANAARHAGRTALKHLTQEGVECSYVLLNSVSYVMKV